MIFLEYLFTGLVCCIAKEELFMCPLEEVGDTCIRVRCGWSQSLKSIRLSLHWGNSKHFLTNDYLNEKEQQLGIEGNWLRFIFQDSSLYRDGLDPDLVTITSCYVIFNDIMIFIYFISRKIQDSRRVTYGTFGRYKSKRWVIFDSIVLAIARMEWYLEFQLNGKYHIISAPLDSIIWM